MPLMGDDEGETGLLGQWIATFGLLEVGVLPISVLIQYYNFVDGAVSQIIVLTFIIPLAVHL